VRKWHFPARNRIISGLSRLVVVAEAPESSGALITASFALEQGRDLVVARAGVSSPRGRGGARLAEEGAVVIDSAAGILEEWGLTGDSLRGKIREERETLVQDQGGVFLASSLARELDIKL
jgi:DNA processing protein